MRILFTNTGPWGTGSFTMAQALTKELIALGHDVKLFFPDSGLLEEADNFYYSNPELYHIWKFPLKSKEAELKYFPLMIPDPHPRNPLRNTFSSLQPHEIELYCSEFEREIKKIIKEFKPDVIECQHIWLMDHIIRKLGYPYFCTAHYSDQLGFEFDPRIRPIATESAQGATRIFAISDFVKKEVIRLYNVPEESVTIAKNGYDRSTFTTKKVDRKKVVEKLGLPIPDDAFIVTFAGKLSKTKGVDILHEACHLLGSNSNIHFLICGSGEKEGLFSENFSFDRFHILGHQEPERLAELHNIAHSSVLPSRSEGFGIAALEAMGCGCPLVFTDTGGLTEYAVGRKVPSENPRALAEAILSLRKLNKEELAELSEKALNVAQTFSWKRIAKERVKIYENSLHL